MKILAASLSLGMGVVCACSGGDAGGGGGGGAGRSSDLVDAGGISVDASGAGSGSDSSGFEPTVGHWEGTTTLGSATDATFDTAVVYGGNLYWIGDGLQSMATTGGAVTPVTTPSAPAYALTADAQGFAYVDASGAIGVAPWTGAGAHLIAPTGSDTWTSEVVVGDSVYATSAANTSLWKLARDGSGARVEVAGPSTGDGCGIIPSQSITGVTRLIADSANVYYEGIYAAIDASSGQPQPGCRVQPDGEPFNWYYAAVPLAGSAPFVTAFRGILTGAVDTCADLVGTSNNLVTDNQAPAAAALTSGGTSELATTSPIAPDVGGTDVRVHDGIVYWTESALGTALPQITGAAVRCVSLADPTTTVKTISTGEGTARGLVIADQVYFQVCDGDCEDGVAIWRSAPRCE